MNRLLILFLFGSSYLFGQSPKSIEILETTQVFALDGVLDEPSWKIGKTASNFVQNEPNTGENSERRTEVSIRYDHAAIYIGAQVFDEKDSMSLTLSQRDDVGNADWFGVIIDPYNAGTIGFAFIVTSAGVQIDELHQVNGVDNAWNAVWQSKVVVLEDRWVAEMKIPFSAFRFPNQTNQPWGINFMRNIRRKREISYWNHVDPTGINTISQQGELEGIKNITAPIRLSFTPYVSGYAERFENQTNYSLNGGMDVKFGLNEAFTLDMTLVPDFGQVRFDNQVLNLSPFEVRFNENRQFFTEGTELFNKLGVFYSRRVGGKPINANAVFAELDSNEVVLNNPTTTQLINASKLSGRTKKGMGIGVFNALTAPVFATIKNNELNTKCLIETAPMANYSVFVLDQNLKNNSSVTLTNTNVMREGNTYDANLTGISTELFTNAQKYSLTGAYILSQRFEENNADFGSRFRTALAKSAGNFLWTISYDQSDINYNPNDLGFQTANNKRTTYAQLNYNIYKPFWRLYRLRSSMSATYNRIILPNEYADFSVSASLNGTFLNFMTAGFSLNANPVENKDWFEPRLNNRFYLTDRNINVGGFFSSDYSKKFALDGSLYYRFYQEINRADLEFNLSPRFRFNDKFILILGFDQILNKNNEGLALTRDFKLVQKDENPIFAKRDRLTLTHTIAADYIFTNRMGVTFNLRHYWSNIRYNDFFELLSDGTMSEIEYDGLGEDLVSLHNNNYNAFTIDMVYRWVFAPGSELSLVWKNSVFNSSEVVAVNFVENFENVTNAAASNSLSIRALFYVDFWTVKQKLKNRI